MNKYLFLFVLLHALMLVCLVGVLVLLVVQWPLLQAGFVQSWVPALTCIAGFLIIALEVSLWHDN